jgi:hypothetical protein
MIRAINKTDNEDWGWAKEDRKNACVIEYSTGRQLRPLSSVLYRIISKRRYILAAQLLLREKSGA